LQGGLPTDRLYAEWWLKSPRVQTILGGGLEPKEAIERITVPHAIYQWKQDPKTRSLAQELQETNRKTFESAFGRGLAAIGYERDADGNGTFLLGKWNDEEQGAWS
jgi:predicted GNAT superfamily acetyltransferase